MHEAHDFMKDNEYITSGYRINFNSVKRVAQSLFMLHNESVNIWSHLLGALFVVFLAVYTTIFIKSHKNILTDNFITNLNMTHVNEDLKALAHPVIELLPNFNNIT
jgi:hypothetical protein